VGVLVAVVQTPGLSHFFGCTPLGPVGWSIATGTALGATLANSGVTRLVERLPQPPTPGVDLLNRLHLWPTHGEQAPDGGDPSSDGGDPSSDGGGPSRAEREDRPTEAPRHA
jgi:hypothetical protein